MKGKFIVIDGTDGTGKATQTALLVEHLKKENFDVLTVDFPRYGEKSAGAVEDYLNGKYGTALELGAYIPSTFYAIDRFAAKNGIIQALEKGQVVISNRYVTANMGHQGSKISDEKERLKFFKWAEDLEYNLYKIPHPDLTLILHIPAEMAQKLVDQKASRAYINGAKRDLHEADLGHLKSAEKTYLEISRLFSYPLIECCRDNKILSPEEISGLIWENVKRALT